MKLTDHDIWQRWFDGVVVRTIDGGEFRAGAEFARDYYEKQIAGLISAMREFSSLINCYEEINEYLDKFEGKQS